MLYVMTIWVDKNDPEFDILTSPTRGDVNINKQEQGIYDNSLHAHSVHAPSDAEKNALNTVIDANYVHTDNNFTSTLKTNYDTAYTHSQSAHAPTDADNTSSNETSHTSVNAHMALTAEHLNWSVTGAEVIHVSRYTNTTYSVQDGELSENNLANALKTNYDTAYTHSQSTHAPSNAEQNHADTVLKSVNNHYRTKYNNVSSNKCCWWSRRFNLCCSGCNGWTYFSRYRLG